MASNSLKDEKKALRKRIREELSRLSEEVIYQQSTSVTKKIIAMPEYRDAQSFSIFLSMPGREISTTDIVLDALRRGKRVFIPYIHSIENDPKTKVMDMLRLKDEDDLRCLQPDSWGIPSLSSNSIDHRENARGGTGINSRQSSDEGSSGLDMIFVPGVAFDVQNNRLGHGKGFYDRYLSELDEDRKKDNHNGTFPKLIGLALREQLLAKNERVPINDNDWKIDQFVCAD